MPTVVVSSGVTSNGLVVSAGETAQVVSGGVVDGGQVLSGGVLVAASGASIDGLAIASGGVVSGAGALSGGIVDDGLLTGVQVGDTYVSATLDVQSGGSASNISMDAQLTVEAGGAVSAITLAVLNQHGSAALYGSSTGLVLANPYTSAVVEAGGVASGTHLVSGYEIVASGGAAYGAIVEGGALETVYSGGADYGAVLDGAAQYAGPGGQMDVNSGGLVSGATVRSGGGLYMSSGGVAEGVTVSSGGRVVFDTFQVASGQTIGLYAYGTMTSTTVFDGVTVLSGGVLATTGAPTVLSGGTLLTSAGEMVSYVMVSAGGLLLGPGDINGVVSDYGVVSGAVVSGFNNATVEGPGSDLYVQSGGSAVGVSVGSGARLHLSAGGMASNVTISSGGVYEGAITVGAGQTFSTASPTVTSTTVYGGVTLLSGAIVEIDNEFAVASGGALVLSNGEVVSSLSVASGGHVEGAAVLTGSGVIAGAVDTVVLQAGAFLEIKSGGSVGNLIFGSSGGALVPGELQVDPGGRVSGTALVGGGDVLTLAQGVSVTSLQVFAGGVVDGPGNIDGVLFDAGTLSGVTLGSGSQAGNPMQIQPGGVVNGVTVDDAAVTFNSGASAGGLSVSWGGQVTFQSGAVVSGAVVSDHGWIEVDPGAAATNVVVSSGGTYHLVSVGPGQVFTLPANGAPVSGAQAYGPVTVLSGALVNVGYLTVLSGGEVLLGGQGLPGADIEAGGSVLGPGGLSNYSLDAGVLSGASVTGAGWSPGVNLEVLSGGLAAAVTVGVTSASNYATSAVVDAGGLLQFGVLGPDSTTTDLGVAAGAVVGSGGTLAVSAGGVAIGGLVTNGGDEVVSSGGIDRWATLTGGQLEALSGGTVSGAYVESSAELLNSGGRAYDTVLDGGTLMSGSAYDTTVDASGVLQAGLTSGSDCLSGGVINTYGSSVGDLIEAGGAQTVFAGLAAGTIVASGGLETVNAGAAVSGAAIYAGGGLILMAGGAATGSTVYDGGGLYLTQTVTNGQTLVVTSVTSTTQVSGVTVMIGGFEDLVSGLVYGGGALTLATGATADNLVVSAGGVVSGPGAIIGSASVAGSVNGAVLGDVSWSGSMELLAGASANALELYNGQLLVDAGATVTGTTLADSFTDANDADVYGRATGTTIGFGDAQIVESGGSASQSVVQSGGFEIVVSGGTLSGAAVHSGGDEFVLAGASARSVTVSSGGSVFFQQVISGGHSYTAGAVGHATTVSGVTILAGGYLDVTETYVDTGATLVLAAGGSGDNLAVQSGGLVSGPGVMIGDNAAAGTVTGVSLGTAAAFGGLELVSGGGASGLTVIDGELLVDNGCSASGIKLAPSIVLGGAVGAGAARAAVGGAPGRAALPTLTGLTNVLDDCGYVSGTQVGSGSILLADGGLAAGSVISSGGLETVDSGGVASGTLVLSGGYELIAYTGAEEAVTVSSGGFVEVQNGAGLSGVTLHAGAIIDLDSVSAAAVSLVGSQILLTSGGVTVDSVALAGPPTGLSFSLLQDGLGGTEVVASAASPMSAGAPATLTATNGAAASISDAAVLGRVTDSNSTALSVTGAALAAGSSAAGTVSLNATNQTLVFTPAAGFAGTAVVNVTVADANGFSVIQPVDVSVVVQASAPVVTPPNTVTTTVNGNFTTIRTVSPTGALISTETILVTGGVTQTQYYNAAGAQTSATITTVNGAITQVQNFDGAWKQLNATITDTLGGGDSIVQSFDGNWTQTGAVSTTVNGAVTIVQTFNPSWVQQSATITTVNGALTETQDFDGGWNQTGATLTYALGGGTVETQTFNAGWAQTRATITSHPSANQTEVQTFNAAWQQTGATLATVSNGQTTTQSFNGSWVFQGATIDTPNPDAALSDRLDTYGGDWNPLSEVDTFLNGGQSYFAYGTGGGGQSFTAAAGHSTTFVFTRGQVAGDTLTGLHTNNLGGAIHDVIDFEGFGAGAHLAQVDATHWQVVSTNNATETFTLAGAATLGDGDYAFVAAGSALTSASVGGAGVALFNQLSAAGFNAPAASDGMAVAPVSGAQIPLLAPPGG